MTTEQKVTRKLRAILSADVKGYSLLMTNDEASTIQTLKEYRRIMSEIIKQHSGRVVDAPGDNLLAEFSSVVNAVECSVEIQNALKIRNEDLPDDKRLEFRIGVNIGDVVHDGDSLYGEGVNIAARIEGLAEPGGICISRGAYDHIRNKLGFGYEYIGEHSVKNIKQPVRVYKILMDSKDAGKLIGDEPKPLFQPGSWATVIVASIALIIIGYLIFHKAITPEFEPASLENMALPLPDKPSIAVLPFDNMSGDKEQEYFSDGIAEDIITTLSKTDQLFVIARNSTYTYKGKPIKIKQVAEELGVRYVLEGSIRKSEGKVRITAQLIDATTGNHIWAERYDRDLKDIFALQDEITINIVTALRIKLTDGELAHMGGSRFKKLDVYLKVMETLAKVKEGTEEAIVQYGRLAQEIIDMDPDSWAGYQHLGWYNLFLAIQGKSPKESITKAFKLAQNALSKDDSNAITHVLLGNIYLVKRKYEKAIDAGERAVALQPNSALAHGLFGRILCYADRLDQSIEHLKKAIRLDPFPDHFVYTDLCRSYTLKGEYEKALAAITKALHRAPYNIMANCGQVVIYVLLDRQKEAEDLIKNVLEINPKFSLKSVSRAPFKNKAQLKFISDALRKAGLPEKPPTPLPDKPSIAVLPFVNMSGDPEQEYFSDGITEDIITALSKTPKMFVIARNSTFTYKGKSVKMQEVGRDLGVRYVLEGSVRKINDKVRINAQLIDAKTGHHLWAEKYDRNLKNIFALQDEITKKIISSLQVELTEGEQANVYARGTDNLEAYLKAMKANWLLLNGTKDGILKGLDLAEEAVDLDPNYAFGYKVLGTAHGIKLWHGLSKNPGETLKRTIELHRKSVELDDSLAIAHAGLGYWLMYPRQHDKAVAEGERAFILEPGSADTIHLYATILTYAGRRKEAIPLFEEALRLNPKPPNTYLRHYGVALRDSGLYEKSLALAERAVKKEPDDIVAWLMVVSNLSLSGHKEEARTAAKEVMRINSKFSVARIERVTPHKDRAVAKRFADSLRKAGLPD